MGILRRTADIFAANLNDLVDRFEDPVQMLRHAVREIEALLSATTSAVARSIAAEKLLAKARAAQMAQAEEWRRRATEAIDAGDETLARRAIGRKLDHESAVAAIDGQLADARGANETLRRQLDLLRDKHAAARTRLMLVSAQQTAAEAQAQIFTRSRSPVGEGRAFARFERFYERAEFAQAEAEALLDLETGGELDLASQFDRNATERAIDDELARMKTSHHGVDS
ncbi:MAG: PspA/IM30 family protein [Pirellulales bacterium]